MNVAVSVPYPGSQASVVEVLALAEVYHRAALVLLAKSGKGDALRRAPGRLCALHAIELYLSAFLRSHGEPPRQARAWGHSLAGRVAAAAGNGLVLRRRTAAHLERITVSREYLVLRYGPEQLPADDPVNRLTATLAEVAKKVDAAVSRRARALAVATAGG